MIVGLDTNILAYAEGINDSRRQQKAVALIERLPVDGVLVPVQVLGELFRVLTLKKKLSAGQARAAILCWQDAFLSCDTTSTAFKAAMDLTANHHFSFWDALIVCVLAENGCRYLLSEDMQEGFVWQGMTIVNPFAEPAQDVLGLLSP